MPGDRLRKMQDELLDLFALATDLPIVSFEYREGQWMGSFPERGRANFESHCNLLHTFPGGRKLCEEDMCQRAARVLETGQGHLSQCHAGLYNLALPIRETEGTHTVVLYGQMRLAEAPYQQTAWEKHCEVRDKLGLTTAQGEQLWQALLQAKQFPRGKLVELQHRLPQIATALNALIDGHEVHSHVLRRAAEKICHELKTRLQAMVATAANLRDEWELLAPTDLRHELDVLVKEILALDTVVENLSDQTFLSDYRFTTQSIVSLLYLAKHLYEAEAARRGIEIAIHLQGYTDLHISSAHLQYAFSNLLHNAVKYSFRGTPSRPRRVQVTGAPYPGKPGYAVTFENYGVGILACEKIKIFQKGYQGKLTQREFRTGAGQGLAFVQQVIERHHGSIEVESTLMADTQDPLGRPHRNKFTVYLPYRQPGDTA